MPWFLSQVLSVCKFFGFIDFPSFIWTSDEVFVSLSRKGNVSLRLLGYKCNGRVGNAGEGRIINPQCNRITTEVGVRCEMEDSMNGFLGVSVCVQGEYGNGIWTRSFERAPLLQIDRWMDEWIQ